MTIRRILWGTAGALSVAVVSLAATTPTPLTRTHRAATEVETAFAESLAPAQAVKTTNITGEADGLTLQGTAVRLQVSGVDVTRLTFGAEQQALAFAARALETHSKAPRVIEVQGNQVLVLEGALSDARQAAQTLNTAWEAPFAAPQGNARALAVLNLEGVEHSMLVRDARFSSVDQGVRKTLAIGGDTRLHLQTATTSCDMAAGEAASVSIVAPRIERLRVLRRYLVNLAALRGAGQLPS